MTENPPAWGRLIEDARERLDPPVSQNEAARLLDMSGTNWRRIVSGVSGPMHSKRGAGTVARMARLVKLAPEDLDECGHSRAAEELRALQPHSRVTDEDVLASGLSAETKRDLLEMRELVARWVEAGDDGNVRRAARVVRALDEDERDAG